MRKCHILGVSLFAMLVFGAFASQALAETVWLVGGARPTEEVLVLNEGELLLLDTVLGLTIDIDCSGLSEGVVGGMLDSTGVLMLGANLDEITRITDLNGNEPPILCEYLERGPCEASTLTADVDPFGLPWLTELLLPSPTGANLDDIFGANGLGAGWIVLDCLILGIANENKCTAEGHSADIDNNATAGDVVALFSPGITGKALCTATNEETGEVEGEILIFTESGASLAVSE